ncbi:MAG TPA: hypothetical protein VFX18_02505 [Candidatus Nitrosocosmicus sp.]|nr:hypothetical protein [Candidatus Nitrosocosmicus sp.]
MKYITIWSLLLIFLVTSTLPDIYTIVINNNINKIKLNWLTLGLTTSNDLQNKASITITKNTLNYTTSNNSSIKGLLNVVVLVDNKGIGNKTASDFNIIVHANSPIPSSFLGSVYGTTIKLGMGMYSISENHLKNYNPYYSADCFGGIMSNIIKKCVITNIYSNMSSYTSSYR